MEFLEGHPPREQRLRYYVDVYSTAQKWKLLFQARSMIDPKFYLTFYFCEDLEALGFEVDSDERYRNRLESLMKEKSLTKEEAQRELFENIDLQTLGNHLLSYWRYWNHWAMADMDEEAYEYFIKCLDKMMDLSRPGIPYTHEEYRQYFREYC